MGAQGILTAPIPRPLDVVADDVVYPIGGDEEDPVCVLCSRGYFKRLVLSQLVRDLRESLLGFIEAFIESVDHTSEGWGLINARSSTGGLEAASGGALHRFCLVRLLAGVNQPYHHTISHALLLLCWAFLCQIVSIARIAPADEKFSTRFSVASRNTLLRYLALFVATFGGVTALVDNLRDVRPPRCGRVRRLLQRTSENAPLFSTHLGEYG